MSQYLNTMYGMMNPMNNQLQNPNDPNQAALLAQIYSMQQNGSNPLMNMAQNLYQVNPLAALNLGYYFDPNLMQAVSNQSVDPNKDIKNVVNNANNLVVEKKEEIKEEAYFSEVDEEERERLEKEKAEKNKFQIEELLGKRATMMKNVEDEKEEIKPYTPNDNSEESDLEKTNFKKRVNIFENILIEKTNEDELKEMMTSSLDKIISAESSCNKFIIEMFDSL